MRLNKALPVMLILLASPAAVAEEKSPSSHEVARYVVRPGDTLESLTARYLGEQERWRENWQLNADSISDPHRIFPGQKIKLLLPEKLKGGVLLTKTSNRVEDQPTPLAWTEALEGELLRARDGIKTYESSSAQLRFPDETLMILTEQSTVFLGEETRAPAQVDRRKIEILVGQADLEGPTTVTETSSEFEIVLGDATAMPRAGEDSALQTRARRPQSGGAQLMVYSGESDLEAAGAKVKVATGMGSSVPEGEPPSPPEILLPAPAGLAPAAGSELATPRPAFSWQPVPEAQSYTLEICRDALCGSLVERAQELTETTWQPAGLPVEALFFRVTAVSASGLDGYPSPSVPFEVLTDVEDTVPPEIRISFTGPQVAPRSGLNDRWILGPGMEIEVEVEDAAPGVRGWTAMLDGEEVPHDRLKGPWSAGDHTISVVAVDGAGNRRESEVPFIFDPDPPDLSWGVEGVAMAVAVLSGEPSTDPGGPEPALRGRRLLRVGKVDWQLDSDLAEVILRPQTRKPIGLEGLGALGPKSGLWVLAEDPVCSDLGDLRYELVTGQSAREYVLWVEAVDCVGNARRGSVTLVRQ